MLINPICITKTQDSAIKFGPENGRCAIIKNPRGKKCRKIKVDGCAITIGKKADWIFESLENDVIIIELKGKHVVHGAEQVIETAKKWKEQDRLKGKVAGLIIGHQCPGATTAMQIRKSKFATQFGGPIHVVNKNDQFEIDHILSFKGPYKS